MRCPVDSLQQNGMTIYTNFLDAVNDFQSLTSQKFEGENLAEQNKTKWHKSCYLKFSASKLMRVKKQLEKNINVTLVIMKKECQSACVFIVMMTAVMM